MVLAVTSLLTYLEPAVGFEACDKILNFRWHRARMVLAKLGRSLSRSLFLLRAALGFPEFALAPRPEVLRPLAGDCDLMLALVRHVDLTPNVFSTSIPPAIYDHKWPPAERRGFRWT